MIASAETLPDWEASKPAICDRIRSVKKTLKILLKTRNEIEFLRPWVEHHAAIVGLDGLVIFDNGSTEPSVVEQLQALSETCVVARFSGLHDDFHRTWVFGDLYAAVADSADYFIVLDTDEFLSWIGDEGEVAPKEEIVGRIQAMGPQEVIMGLWADNEPGFADRFILYDEDKPGYPAGLSFGKSILSTKMGYRGTLCHNFQLDGPALDQIVHAPLIVRHMKNLLPSQRIRTNIDKLRRYKLLTAQQGVEAVAAMDPAKVKKSLLRRWVREVQQLHKGEDLKGDRESPLAPGVIEIPEQGDVRFSSAIERRRYLSFRERPGQNLANVVMAGASKLNAPWWRRSSLSDTEGAPEAKPLQDAAEPGGPHLTPQALIHFESTLAKASCYLEYGSGGSTRLAAKLKVPHVFSVESDAAYAAGVVRSVEGKGESTNLRMLVADIGETGLWGKPKNSAKFRTWHTYPTIGWRALREAGLSADLIMVDGRFRVACFLVSYMLARPGTIILFDDYGGRRDIYGFVEKYGKPERMIERMAQFIVSEERDLAELALDLAAYSIDPR